MDRQDLAKLYLEATEQALNRLTPGQQREVARLHAAHQIMHALHTLSDQVATMTRHAIRIHAEEEPVTGNLLVSVLLPHRALTERICVRRGTTESGPTWRLSDSTSDLNALANIFNPSRILTEGEEASMSPYTPDTPEQIARGLAQRVFAAATEGARPKDIVHLFAPALKLTGLEQNEPLTPEVRSARELANDFHGPTPTPSP